MTLLLIILTLCASASSLVIGMIVLSGGRDSRYRRSFVGLSVLVCIWILACLFFMLADDSGRLTAALASYAIAMMVAVTLLVFCLYLIHPYITTKRIVYYILPGISMAVVSAVPNVIALGVDYKGVITNLWTLGVYGIVLIVYLVMSCIVLLHGRRRLSTEYRSIVTITLVGLSVSIILGLVCNLFLPMIGVYAFVQLGPASSMFFIGSIGYAILRHGFFDVRLAVVRGMVYILTLATLTGVYFGLAYVVSLFLLQDTSSGISVSLVNIILAMVLAFVFQPIKHFFDKVTDRFFYFGSYNTEEFMSELGEILTSTTDLKTLLVKISTKIDQTFRSSWSGFAVLRRENGILQIGSGSHTQLDDGMVLRLYDMAGRNKSILQIDELASDSQHVHKPMIDHLQRDGVAMVLPLIRTDSHVGYLFIGNRRAGRYSKRDIRVLETIGNELVIAIQNALSVQEVRELNVSLQRRIDQATQRLMQTNERLKKLDETKDEFISMTSHQLRTPLTSIKGYLSMVLDGDVGPINDQQRKFLEESYESSERMVRLIADFLDISRLQTGRFTVDRHPVDLKKLVEAETESMQRIAAGHGVKLLLQIGEDIPKLLLDEDKLRQVVMNLIDNAIYYSPSGKAIAIRLYTRNNWAVFEVHDQGIGVPLEVQNQLFTKFFRADNARNQRPDGTGVGLFLAKKVITTLEGDMVFDSQPGRGSIFGFRLPIKKLQVPNWQ